MNIAQKNKWRLIFKIVSMALAFIILISAIIMDYSDKEAKNLISIAPMLFVFIGAVFGADYFSKPHDDFKG
jgi:polyferredoxin